MLENKEMHPVSRKEKGDHKR